MNSWSWEGLGSAVTSKVFHEGRDLPRAILLFFLPSLVGEMQRGKRDGMNGASTRSMMESRVTLEGFLLEAISHSVVCGTEQ